MNLDKGSGFSKSIRYARGDSLYIHVICNIPILKIIDVD